MYPRRNWDSLNPSPAIVCALPPDRGGDHSLAAKGVGESQFRRLEKKLSALPTLWIYIFLRSVCLFCCREIAAGPNVGIYRSLTEA